MLAGMLDDIEWRVQNTGHRDLAEMVILLEKTVKLKRVDFQQLQQSKSEMAKELRITKTQKKDLQDQVTLLNNKLARYTAMEDTSGCESPVPVIAKKPRLSSPETTTSITSMLTSPAKTTIKITTSVNKPRFGQNMNCTVGRIGPPKRKMGSGLLREVNEQSAIRSGYDGFGGHTKFIQTKNFKPEKKKVKAVATVSRDLSIRPPLPTLDSS